MLGKLKTEVPHFWRAWWCRGHASAVLMLVATVALFRDARDLIFWAALGFLVLYTAVSGRRYRAERRVRTQATITAQHTPQPTHCACGKLIFDPRPIDSMITLDLPAKHSKNGLLAS